MMAGSPRSPAIWRASVWLGSLVVALLLAGCAPERSVRVEPAEGVELVQPGGEREGVYRVASGDTLYGIAFKHGMDYRELAQLNHIAAPYTIYVGQQLQLGQQRARNTLPPSASNAAGQAHTTTAGAKPPHPTARSGGVVENVIREPAPGKPPATLPPKAPATAPVAQPGSKPATAQVVPPPAATPSVPAAGKPAATAALPADDAVRWRWPAAGKIVGTFASGDPTRQGINIAGAAGDAVEVAADGVVVYSGSGLIGYGELIIVKHSEGWLSAYGHNRKRLVAEGDKVKRGQVIAEMGRSGTDREMLHFEIRVAGKPTDPAKLLPRR